MDALLPRNIRDVYSGFIRYVERELVSAMAAHEKAGTFSRELVLAMRAQRTTVGIRRQTAHG